MSVIAFIDLTNSSDDDEPTPAPVPRAPRQVLVDMSLDDDSDEEQVVAVQPNNSMKSSASSSPQGSKCGETKRSTVTGIEKHFLRSPKPAPGKKRKTTDSDEFKDSPVTKQHRSSDISSSLVIAPVAAMAPISQSTIKSVAPIATGPAVIPTLPETNVELSPLAEEQTRQLLAKLHARLNTIATELKLANGDVHERKAMNKEKRETSKEISRLQVFGLHESVMSC
jgi:hypothetical protein